MGLNFEPYYYSIVTKIIQYRSDVDGLRALAVMLVLAVHAFPSRFPNGYIGVDVFFVISGYLITSIVARELSAGDFSIAKFYIKRINRIYPALLLILAFVLLTGPLVMYASEYKASLSSIWTGALFSANVDFFLSSGYWDAPSKVKPLLHLWSLGVEEQFYLAWPILLAFFFWRKLSLLSAALVVFFLSLSLNIVLTYHNQAAAFYLPFGRLWELAAGGILALTQFQSQNTKLLNNTAKPWNNSANLMGFGGAVLLAVMHFASMDQKLFPGFYAPVVVFSVILIIHSGSDSFFNRYFLSNRLIVYLGKISYPLYLWHWPLLVYARLIGDGQLTSFNRNIALIAAFVLAIATYHLIEKPLSMRVVRRGLLSSILFTLMIIIAGTSGLMQFLGSSYIPGFYPNKPVTGYNVTKISSHGKIALLGDSNAGHLSYGLGLLYGERLKTFATPGWPYLEGIHYRSGYVPHVEHKGSPTLTEKTLHEIISDPEIKIVVVANAYLMYLPGDNIRIGPTGHDLQSVNKAYETGLTLTINKLASAGKQVLLIKSIPTYPELATVTACTDESRPFFRIKPSGCIKERSILERERQEYENILKMVEVQSANFHYFDTLNVLCDELKCYVNRDGVLYYIDGGHFTTAGSQLMANQIAYKIERILGK